jgi:hypothetical protein
LVISLSPEPITDAQGEDGFGIFDRAIVDHGDCVVPRDDRVLKPLIELELGEARFEILAQKLQPPVN